jgi:hypothetical protein
MNVLSTASSRVSSHALISNVSCLFGLLIFLQQIWSRASIEHTLVSSVGAGLSVYLTLAVSYAIIRQVLAREAARGEDDAPADATDEGAEAPSEDAGASTPETAEPQNA